MFGAVIFVDHEVVSEQLKGLGLTRAQEVQDRAEEEGRRLHAASRLQELKQVHEAPDLNRLVARQHQSGREKSILGLVLLLTRLNFLQSQVIRDCGLCHQLPKLGLILQLHALEHVVLGI